MTTRSCSDDTAKGLDRGRGASRTHPPQVPPTPTVIQPQVSTKQAHIPQLYSLLESWLKFTPWVISCGGVFAAGMCVAGAQCPSPDSSLCWSPKKACGQMNPESQPPAVPGNGMCCWGVAGRRRGHWVLRKVGAPITRSPLFC